MSDERKLLVGDRDHWFRAELPDCDRPIFVRAAVRVLAVDDRPFAAFLDRIGDFFESRSPQSRYHALLDYAPIRALYRARKRIAWPSPVHLGRAFDRWLFDPEGNPAIDRAILSFAFLVLIYSLVQIARVW